MCWMVISKTYFLQRKLAEMDVRDKVSALETQAKDGYIAAPPSDPVDNIEVTVICKDVPQRDDEDAMGVAHDTMEALELGGKLHIAGAPRLPAYNPRHCGLFKIAFGTVDEKITGLRAKMNIYI